MLTGCVVCWVAVYCVVWSWTLELDPLVLCVVAVCACAVCVVLCCFVLGECF